MVQRKSDAGRMESNNHMNTLIWNQRWSEMTSYYDGRKLKRELNQIHSGLLALQNDMISISKQPNSPTRLNQPRNEAKAICKDKTDQLILTTNLSYNKQEVQSRSTTSGHDPLIEATL